MTTTRTAQDTEANLNGITFDGYLIEEANEEHPNGEATRVTSPNGAVYVYARPLGDIIRHEGPADVYPAHVAKLCLSIVRQNAEAAR